MKHRFTSLAALAVLLAAPIARADDALPPLPPATEPRENPTCFQVRSDGMRVPIPCPGEPPPAPRCHREEEPGTRAEVPCSLQPEPETESRWYGWQILIVDGASIVTMPIAVGLAGYLLGGPIVHAAHDRWGMAGVSVGVRVAFPAVGVVAMGGPNCKGDFCGLGLLVGAAAGAAVAVVLDVALLSHEQVPITKSDTAARDRRVLSLQPAVAPELTPERRLHGATFGLSGTF